MPEVSEQFGASLRELRIRAGLSLGELARKINYSKSYISRIESGHKPPSPDIARRCDAVLDSGGALTALLTAVPEQLEEQREIEADETWELPSTGSGAVRFDRRAALGLAAGFLARPNHPVELTEDLLDGLRTTQLGLRSLGRITSPAVVLGSAVAHVDSVRSLAIGSREPLRPEFFHLAALGADYVGWLAQERGDDQAALWWINASLRLSRESESREFESYALVRRAEIALYRQDALTTVELAQAAQQVLDVAPRVLGQAARIEAQGHALAGDPDASGRALDRAAEFLSRHDTDHAMFGSGVTGEIDLARGWMLFDLGLPAEAAELLDRAVPMIPPGGLRARTRFGVRRALAHAGNGEIDHACALAAEVLPDAIQIDSATVRIDVRQLSRILARWYQHAAVRVLQPSLLKALKVGVAP